jgi:hypothetical protein
MVATDHAPLGSAAAFFKDSMSRDAMSGTNIGCILWDASEYQSLKGRLGTRREENLHPGHELNILLSARTL